MAAVVRALQPGWRIAYVMTDAAALPLALSDLVADLKAAALLDVTITAGQAFGGDLEAVTVASALALAAHVAGADVAVVAMGPGGAGTGTELGFAALEVGGVLDTVAWLGGTPIACLRYAAADPRPRHTASAGTASPPCSAPPGPASWCPSPRARCAAPIEATLREAGVAPRHRVVRVPVPDVGALLARAGVQVTTMGRRPADDPSFFAVAGAAGAAACDAASLRDGTGTVQS